MTLPQYDSSLIEIQVKFTKLISLSEPWKGNQSDLIQFLFLKEKKRASNPKKTWMGRFMKVRVQHSTVDNESGPSVDKAPPPPYHEPACKSEDYIHFHDARVRLLERASPFAWRRGPAPRLGSSRFPAGTFESERLGGWGPELTALWFFFLDGTF